MNKIKPIKVLKSNDHKGIRKTLIVLVVISILFGIVLIFIKQQYQHRVDVLKDELSRIQDTVVVPADGIVQDDSSRCADYPVIGWTDISCPEVSRSWLLQIPYDEDKSKIAGDIIRGLNYEKFSKPIGNTSYASTTAFNGKWTLNLIISSDGIMEPFHADENRQWVIMTAIINETSYIPE